MPCLLCDVAAGGRRDLHQSKRLGARDRSRIEPAFLARDRIGELRFDLRSDRIVPRQPFDRIGMGLERQAAADRGPAEQHGRARIIVALSQRGDRRERADIGGLVGEVGDGRSDKIALVDGVEDLDRAHDFEPRDVRRGSRRHRQPRSRRRRPGRGRSGRNRRSDIAPRVRNAARPPRAGPSASAVRPCQ